MDTVKVENMLIGRNTSKNVVVLLLIGSNLGRKLPCCGIRCSSSFTCSSSLLRRGGSSLICSLLIGFLESLLQVRNRQVIALVLSGRFEFSLEVLLHATGDEPVHGIVRVGKDYGTSHGVILVQFFLCTVLTVAVYLTRAHFF